jgi:glyoxylase-like metal-dependent hydrolase (beta-lactamase superfamily II)
MSPSPHDRPIGRVTVLAGEGNGKYPHGNSLLVDGRHERVIVDPSLSLLSRSRLPPVDRVLNSHCHEDHIAGNHLFPSVPWHLHELDLPGIRSLDGMMAIYGFAAEVGDAFRDVVVRDFHYTPRLDPVAFRDGDVFDLGDVRLRVVHAPGHTRGHSVFHLEPDDVLYLGDIDLSSFGPYYGDAWSSLEDFERTLRAVRAIEARWYATFHHIGVLEGREAFLARLDRFAAVIDDRERRLLDFLREPRTLDEIAAHRFVYRPGDSVPYAEVVERRSMSQHVERLVRDGRLRTVEPGRWVRRDPSLLGSCS